MERSLVMLLVAVASTFADERTFAVSVDGKSIGEFTLSSKPQGPQESEIVYKIKMSNTLYSLRLEGSERWKENRLVRLESSAGEKREISLVSGNRAYTLKAGVKEATVNGDVWPTTFFMRPDADK